ncbi:MAG: transposase family protein [Actinomycetia bacterium]|jgi:predicted transposase YbfD/YdcC|nr:transposase family protein [Actinomycetes bacterium]
MPVSHVPVPSRALDAGAGQVRAAGLLEVLAQVADPRKRRGRRFSLAFTLAVALVCVLAGARNFREIGDQAADLSQDTLAALGGVPCPLRRKIAVPSEKRIRTLLQDLDGDALDVVIGGWLRSLAAGKPARPQDSPQHVAIDGKWLRGAGDGPVKLFSALQHGDGVIIAQTRIPDDTTETTQVRALLDPVDLTGAVVTADAVHAARETAAYIAGERGADYLLTVKGNTPRLQRAIYDKIQAECDAAVPDHAGTDRSHGRIVRRSLWAAAADESIDFPHAAQIIRIRRDTLDIDGAMIAKEIIHAATSLDAKRANPEALAALTRGQWAIEAVHWIRDTAYREDHSTGYAGDGPQVMATLRNMAISLLRIAGITQITRTLQAFSRDRTRILDVIPL